MSRRARAALVALAAVLLLFGTAACGGDDKKKAEPGSTASSSVTPTATALPSGLPTDFPFTPGGAASGVPSDFPDEVPLLDGQVSLPLGAGSGVEGSKGWVLEIKVSKDLDACFAEAEKALVEAGFTKQPGEIIEGKNHQAQFTKPGYAVIISTSPNDDGSCRLGYEVGQVAG
ncbi:hypothetical protein ABIE44_002192 [Marmoricola sp. OAE513]|uniref:hypothetical protein n=1 Tax=Marmoricola sp. OAE513 TaxID=2817894 RepID=UPI001AE68FD9